MSDCQTEESDIEKPGETGEKPVEEDTLEPAPSDDEDDCEGYFLEPVGNGVNIAEKIAEANAKLLEEEEGEEEFESRPKKVQFSEELVNFEPSYCSDDDCTESARTSVISEEDVELKLNEEEETRIEDPPREEQPEDSVDDSFVKEEPDEPKPEEDEIAEEIDAEVGTSSEPIPEELDEGNNKLLLVLLPKEQNSSCESIIGEEISEVKNFQVEKQEPQKITKAKVVRPKSAKKCCDMAKISPNLNYSSSLERKPWRGCRGSSIRSKNKPEMKEKKEQGNEIQVEIRGRVKKINIDNLNLDGLRKGEELRRCCDRPKSSYDWRRNGRAETRPNTAPMKRTCAVIKTELPQYNGLRSEYGLSAEQLQERKQRISEIKHQRKEEKIKERQEELRRRSENEEMFRKWLFSKSKKSMSKKPIKLTDTLARSDVYIQTHASYAAKRSVPYSIDYTLNKKINFKKSLGKENKSILVEKLLDKVSPHFKRSFNIYLGVRP